RHVDRAVRRRRAVGVPRRPPGPRARGTDPGRRRHRRAPQPLPVGARPRRRRPVRHDPVAPTAPGATAQGGVPVAARRGDPPGQPRRDPPGPRARRWRHRDPPLPVPLGRPVRPQGTQRCGRLPSHRPPRRRRRPLAGLWRPARLPRRGGPPRRVPPVLLEAVTGGRRHGPQPGAVQAMADVAVVVPWRGGCPHRETAWTWIRARYAATHPDWPVLVGTAPAGDWCKARAVADAVAQTAAEVLVVADADVWTDNLTSAVDKLTAGAAWVVPHRPVYRLDEGRTAAVLAGAPLDPADASGLDQAPYPGQSGGGIVVLRRSTWE